MLVLTRFIGEDLIAKFGDEVLTIRILDVKGRKVRVGLDASDRVELHRKEIADAIATAKNPESRAKVKEPIGHPS